MSIFALVDVVFRLSLRNKFAVSTWLSSLKEQGFAQSLFAFSKYVAGVKL